MAVNGIELAVGQKWRTRSGREVVIQTIDNPDLGAVAPVFCSDGFCRLLNGRYAGLGVNGECAQDLVELIQDAPLPVADVVSEEPVERRASALSIQEGGNHYKTLAIQPIEYVHANKLGFAEGSVIKYITRWRSKNGIADLRKARHFIDLLIELETKETQK